MKKLVVTENTVPSQYVDDDASTEIRTAVILLFTITILIIFCAYLHRKICQKIIQTCRYKYCWGNKKNTADELTGLKVDENRHLLCPKSSWQSTYNETLTKNGVQGTSSKRFNKSVEKFKNCKLEAFLQERNKVLAPEGLGTSSSLNSNKNGKELKNRVSLNLFQPSIKSRSMRSLPTILETETVFENGSKIRTDLKKSKCGHSLAYTLDNSDQNKVTKSSLVEDFRREYDTYIKLCKPEFQNTRGSGSIYYLSDSAVESTSKTSTLLTGETEWNMFYNYRGIRFSKSLESMQVSMNRKILHSQSCCFPSKKMKSQNNVSRHSQETLTKNLTLKKQDIYNSNTPIKNSSDLESYAIKPSGEVNNAKDSDGNVPPMTNFKETCLNNLDMSRTYDELAMIFSHYMKSQANPCKRRYCSFARHLKHSVIHDEKQCHPKFKRYRKYPYDQRPACSSGNVCEDTYDEWLLMRGSASERECLYTAMFERRKRFLNQPHFSNQESLVFIGGQ